MEREVEDASTLCSAEKVLRGQGWSTWSLVHFLHKQRNLSRRLPIWHPSGALNSLSNPEREAFSKHHLSQGKLQLRMPICSWLQTAVFAQTLTTAHNYTLSFHYQGSEGSYENQSTNRPQEMPTIGRIIGKLQEFIDRGLNTDLPPYWPRSRTQLLSPTSSVPCSV